MVNQSTTSPFAIVIGIGICYVIFLAIKRIQALRQHYKTFETIGVPGPKPTLFLGNAAEFWKKPSQMHEIHFDFIKKYGRVTGIFMGSRGRYLITDPDIIKEIMIKQFAKFPNRSINFNTGFRFDDGLLVLRDQQWKKVRSILTPNFSSNKIKAMRPYLDQSTEILMEKLKKVSLTGESINISQWFAAYTMQIIMAIAFGTDMDCQTNPNNVLNIRARQCLDLKPFAIITAVFMPWIFPYIIKLDRTFINAMKYIDNFADEVLSMRKAQKNSEREDLMRLLIQASDDETKATLTHDETVGQITNILLAGYESTNNTLGYISYLLAQNPTVQDKLIDEIDRAATMDSEEIDYDTAMHKMVYLDMVISESLRFCPPVTSIGREVKEECVIKGVKFMKGFTIGIPSYALHWDPEFWKNPEIFDPERFSPENKKLINPYTYLPFGIGPRACIGTGVALMEIKLCMIKILRSYRFVSCPETEVPLQLRATGTITPKNGIYLKIKKR